ncbi:lactose ABC transporter permease [Spirochaetia bacterium]|nr:lactose ABC transporter permease [Spirochaetia bacterium]
MQKTRRKIKYETSCKINGLVFMLPWILGFIIFFLAPLRDTILYSFNKVEVAPSGGIQFSFSGLQNYIDLFQSEVSTESQPITRVFVDENVFVFTSLPLITIFSLFLAILANAKFPGRGLVRVIFFLPIVLGLQLITDWTENSVGRSMIEAATGTLRSSSSTIRILLTYTFLPENVVLFLTNAMTNIFTLFARTGVQTMIFLAGLQSISPSHYEVAKIEGANAYEIFWQVTIPSIADVTVFVIIYTLIDLYRGSSIAVEVYNFAFAKSKIGVGSALSVIYMLNVLAALGVVWVFMRRVKIIDN